MTKITKLSDMEVGRIYRIKADDTDAKLQVITAGELPLCLVTGGITDVITEDDPPMLVQLIGWARFGNDLFTRDKGIQLFTTNELPEFAWLIAICWDAGTSPRPCKLACDPVITEYQPTQSDS